jgi:hypothetical protein
MLSSCAFARYSGARIRLPAAYTLKVRVAQRDCRWSVTAAARALNNITIGLHKQCRGAQSSHKYLAAGIRPQAPRADGPPSIWICSPHAKLNHP